MFQPWQRQHRHACQRGRPARLCSHRPKLQVLSAVSLLHVSWQKCRRCWGQSAALYIGLSQYVWCCAAVLPSSGCDSTQ